MKYTPGFVRKHGTKGAFGSEMLLPNGAQIYFAHKRKILVVVFCRFLFRQENALEILLLDKITRKTPMIQYMVKFWLFCRDLGMFSENPTFAQLF